MYPIMTISLFCINAPALVVNHNYFLFMSNYYLESETLDSMLHLLEG